MALGLMVSLAFEIGPAAAQPEPSLTDVRNQLDQVVGNRVEATVLLGGQQLPQGGLFGWQFNDVDARILKYPWSTELGGRRPLDVGGLEWTPVLLGSIGARHTGVRSCRDAVHVPRRPRITPGCRSAKRPVPLSGLVL